MIQETPPPESPATAPRVHPASGTQIDSIGYAAAFDAYLAAGWIAPLPLPSRAKKWPPSIKCPDARAKKTSHRADQCTECVSYTGHHGIDPSYPDLMAWAETNPLGNLCLRLPNNPEIAVIGIDVDNYGDKRGGDTLAEAEKRWGVLPPGHRSTSREDGVSGIRLFRVPPGTKLEDVIAFPEMSLGDIEVIQRHHRYMVCWPSIHPEGRPYWWTNERGQLEGIPTPDELPELPQLWIDALTPRTVTEPNGATLAPADVAAALTAGDVSPAVARRLSEAVNGCHGPSRHDNTRDSVLALLRLGERGETGVREALALLGNTFVAAVTADRSRSHAEAVSEYGAMVGGPNVARLLAVPSNVAWVDQIQQSNQVTGAPTLVTSAPSGIAMPPEGPKLWPATALKGAAQARWLAKGRLPHAAISLLVGDEGIGKSLLWVWIAAAVSTGAALPGFGIPARAPQGVIVVVTEDHWATTVRPRLEVAGADLSMIGVICEEEDGSGSPVFPRDMHLLASAEPPPALIVVDAWLDTVPGQLSVKDPQQARRALHPWRELATITDAAVLLLAHTNRVASASARDKYGATGELRKKARMTLFAQTDEDGKLVVGPEKANTAAPIAASAFTIVAVPHFVPTEDDDGTVPKLVHEGESTRTARQIIADTFDAGNYGERQERTEAVEWLRGYIEMNGPAVMSKDAKRDARKGGFSERTLQRARTDLKVAIGYVGHPPNSTWSLPVHNSDGITDISGINKGQRVMPGRANEAWVAQLAVPRARPDSEAGTTGTAS